MIVAVRVLSQKANEAQERALESETFTGLMTYIIEAYRLQIRIASLTYPNDENKLSGEKEIWEKAIKDANDALEAHRKAAQKAQNSDNPEAVLEEELNTFIQNQNPDIELYMQNGDWWGNVAF